MSGKRKPLTDRNFDHAQMVVLIMSSIKPMCIEDLFSFEREVLSHQWVMIRLMEGDPLLEKTYNHVAFKISEEDFDKYVNLLRALDVKILEGRDRAEGD
jgi:hypothetical protein